MEGVSQLKDITLTWEGGGVFYLLTDLPGGSMAVRRTILLPTVTERTTRTFPLDSTLHGGDGELLEGRLVIYRATSTLTLILIDGFVRFRRVGTYIDGTAGDCWESQPISLGGHQFVYLLREFELVASSTGPMTLHVGTELPDSDVKDRYTKPIDTATSTERLPIRVRLPGNVKGQLRQIRIDGVNVLRLFGMRVFAKQLGTNTAWNWYDVPGIADTPESYSAAALPLLASDREWRWVGVPVDAIQ